MWLLHVVLTVTSAAVASGASVLVGLAVLLPKFTCSVEGPEIITSLLVDLVLGSSSVVGEAPLICESPKQVLRNITKMNVPDFTLIVTAWLAVR